jgi:hypothetical protein
VKNFSNTMPRKLLRDAELALSFVLEHFVYSFPDVLERFAGATGFDTCTERGFGYRAEVFAFVVLNMLM